MIEPTPETQYIDEVADFTLEDFEKIRRSMLAHGKRVAILSTDWSSDWKPNRQNSDSVDAALYLLIGQ